MNTVLVEMQLSKSTAGTHVYADPGDDAPIKTLYIRKSALPSPPPSNIKVTLELSMCGEGG